MRAFILDVLYLAALIVFAPVMLLQSLFGGKKRGGWREKLFGLVPRRTSPKRCVWLHAVSVGEVNLLAPILREWEARSPDVEFVITTTTVAGYELATKKYAPRLVCYAPLDFSWAARVACARLRPDLLVLAELEVWPNLIEAAHAAGVKVAVVNGRLSEKSFRGWSRFGAIARPIFGALDFVAAQNDEYAERFRRLGVADRALAVTGNVKFDGCPADRGAPAVEKLRALAGVRPDDFVFLAGSTQSPEETIALEVFQKLAIDRPRLRLVVVPRHPERFEEVARVFAERGVKFDRRSRLDQTPADPTARVLLVDSVGELSSWWGLADAAFVGGSFGRRGGQNMLEPAGYGAAVSFGPNTWNFRDVVGQLLAREAAVVVPHPAALEAFVARVHDEPYYAAQLGRRAAALVREGRGATERTVAALLKRFPAVASGENARRRAG